MHRPSRAVAVVVTANILHILGVSLGVTLLPAAALSAESDTMQRSIDSAAALQKKLPDMGLRQKQEFGDRTLSNASIAFQQQTNKLSFQPRQYSDNPTMPGEGTPDRTQGSGSR